jgi:hypothetical protein
VIRNELLSALPIIISYAVGVSCATTLLVSQYIPQPGQNPPGSIKTALTLGKFNLVVCQDFFCELKTHKKTTLTQPRCTKSKLINH